MGDTVNGCQLEADVLRSEGGTLVVVRAGYAGSQVHPRAPIACNPRYARLTSAHRSL